MKQIVDDSIVETLIETFVAAMKAELVPQLGWPSDVDDNPNLSRTRVLIELVNYRVHELSHSALEEARDGHCLASIVLTRAAFETAVLLASARLKATSALEAQGDLSHPEFERFVMKALFGAREGLEASAVKTPSIFDALTAAAGLPEELVASVMDLGPDVIGEEAAAAAALAREALAGFKSVNVQTHIDAAAKVYPHAAALYGKLSEIAHPNCSGLMEMYVNPRDSGHDVLHLGPSINARPKAEAIGLLLDTLKLFGELREQLENTLRIAQSTVGLSRQ